MSTGLKKTIVLAITGLVATLGFTSVAAASPVEYAALGDSYSSGNGAGSYLDDTACERSANAYPELYAQQSGATLDFQACSGATVADVLNNQLATLSPATTLVSVTVGGNDAGFTNVLANCILGGDAACKTATDSAVDFVHNTLPDQLDGVYSAIRDKAPNAKVVVVGYPHIYFPGDNFCEGGVSNTSRGYVNGAADELDAVWRPRPRTRASRSPTCGRTSPVTRSARPPLG